MPIIFVEVRRMHRRFLPLVIFATCGALAAGTVSTATRRQEEVERAAGRGLVEEGSNTSADRRFWWTGLEQASKDKLTALYDTVWFESIDEDDKIAYLHLANVLYEFIATGADAHSDDSFSSFAPLLLRTAFHSSGTYFLPDGSGGSRGGTIFHHGELQDAGNGCIGVATTQLQALFAHHDIVPLSDAVIVAGTVALDVMEFPRMDLVRVAGGRDRMIEHSATGVTFRDRLPSADDDPLELLTTHYGLTLSELTALVGGAHNFGAAHGKCSGYVGQWTPTPLSWFGPIIDEDGGNNSTTTIITKSPPTFFSDLLRDDWRWYEVCTFYNDTVAYKSIADPFANGKGPDEEHETAVIPTNLANNLPLGCPIVQNREPLICEEQAMRGCDFVDGVYPLDQSPCDIGQLQLRLKSDFSLKANERLRPHAVAFADDADLLATEFGVAYRKVTHLGLDRCGLSGHGCQVGTACDASSSAAAATGGGNVCVLDESYVEEVLQGSDGDSAISKNTLWIILVACAVVVLMSIAAVLVLYNKMGRLLRAVAEQELLRHRHQHASSSDSSSKKPFWTDETTSENTVTATNDGGLVSTSDEDDSVDDSDLVTATSSVKGQKDGQTSLFTAKANNTGRANGAVWEC
jgi:type II secretory pathway pseudopilin PulG